MSDRLSALLILLITSLVVSISGVLSRWDDLVYDVGQKLYRQTVPADLVIVGIDEESLVQLGRWPWSRHLHAAVVNRLKSDGAAVIALDVIFTEPSLDDPSADLALASAIRSAGNVVLPVFFEKNQNSNQIMESLPLPALAKWAAGIGSVHVPLDEDGLARGIYLFTGSGASIWPHFSSAVLRVGNFSSPDLQRDFSQAEQAITEDQAQRPPFFQKDPRRIKFFGPPGSVPAVSYAHVLQGNFSPGTFKNKTVLVGATAAGMGDQFPTAMSGLGRHMSGIEFHANALTSIRNHALVSRVPDWIGWLVCVLLSITPLSWLSGVSPRRGLLSMIAWFFIVLIITMSLPHGLNRWLPPTGALLPILIAYPIWSWRKLESANRFLDHELHRLGQTARVGLGLGGGPALTSLVRGDQMQARIFQIQQAESQLAKLQEVRKETLAFISHDIRAPLAQALMQLDGATSDGDALKQNLNASLAKALKLAEDFLHTSRAEMLDSQQFEEVDLTAVAHQAADDAFQLAERCQIKVVRHISTEPIWILGDFSLLHRAVLNLILNAIKYAPQGSVVTLTLTVTEQEATITVMDHGPGIPLEKQGRLFQRFNQSDELISIAGGSGLGLYFVRVTAEKHRGRVGVNVSEGISTVFSIRLPVLS